MVSNGAPKVEYPTPFTNRLADTGSRRVRVDENADSAESEDEEQEQEESLDDAGEDGAEECVRDEMRVRTVTRTDTRISALHRVFFI